MGSETEKEKNDLTYFNNNDKIKEDVKDNASKEEEQSTSYFSPSTNEQEVTASKEESNVEASTNQAKNTEIKESINQKNEDESSLSNKDKQASSFSFFEDDN